MSSHRALVVIASLVFPVAAQAQQEPPFLFTGVSGRPAAGRGEYIEPGKEDDLVHTTVVVQPKPGGTQGYVIVEVKGGFPIIITPSELGNLVQSPKQGSQGQLIGNDARDDFVVVGSDNTVGVLRGAQGVKTGGVVTGVFEGFQLYSLTGEPPGQPPSPRLVATVDANGDGMDDIVLAGPGGVRLYLNIHDAQQELVSFGFVSEFSQACSLLDVTDIAVGDVDGDEDDDLAFSAAHSPTSGEVQIWKRSTGVGFTQGAVVTFPNPVASVELVKLRAGHAADLVVARHVHNAGPMSSGIVSVHLNPNDPNNPNDPGSGEFTAGTLPGLSFTRWSSTGTVPTFGAAGRIDTDDDLDLVFTENDSIAFPAGTFAQYNPPLSLLVVENHLDDIPSTIAFYTRGTRFSGKSVDPIFLATEAEGIVPLADQLQLTWTADQNAGMGIGELPDADEVSEVSFGSAGTGDGLKFDAAEVVNFETGEMPGDGATAEVAVGELGVRDILDLVVPSLTGNSLTVALGDGGGGFEEPFEVTDIATPPPFYAGGPRRVVLRDLTHDGFADAVVLSDYIDGIGMTDWASVITVLHSNGHTGLVKVQERALEHSGEMAVADIDGDGNQDVVVTRRLGLAAPHDIQIHFGDAAGGLDPHRTPLAIGFDFSPAGMTGGLDIADIDGDTDPDVVVSYARLVGPTIQSGVVVFRNDWPGVHTLRPVQNVFSTGIDVPDVESLVLGQINGTSAIDVAVGLRNGTLWFARGNGSAQGFVSQSNDMDIESSTQGGGSLVLADFDLNSRMDIVSAKGWPAHQSVVQVLLASTDNNFAVSERAGWNPEDYDGAIRPIVGDFDGDLVPDIAIVHYIGEVTVLLSSDP